MPKLPVKRLRQIVSKMPFNSLIGIRLAGVHADGVTIECKLKPEIMNGSGMLHGGVTATLADSAVGIAIMRHFNGERKITTVELKVNYFRPVISDSVSARASLRRIGNHLCIGQVDIFDSEKNLAGIAIVTYMLL
ncbi:MAG: PaaI family thioesterase [Bryobacteraceae bacterium]